MVGRVSRTVYRDLRRGIVDHPEVVAGELDGCGAKVFLEAM
jgi:hypothetical protein